MGKCAKNMKRGYAMGGMVDQEPDQAKLLAGLLSTFQKPEQKSLTQAQIINSDMNNLGKVDSTPGEGEGAAHNWMVQSATDIAQSQGRNPNAAYSPGSRNDPHSAMMPTQPQGIAQPLQQPAYQAPSYRQKQQPRNLLSGIAGYADGGKVESVEELLARMQAKYKTGSQAPAPAPAPAPEPVVQTVQPQPQVGIGGAYNALKNRQQQIDKAAGYANGRKIRGFSQEELAAQEANFNAARNRAIGMAGGVVDSLPYATAQFVPGLNVPLGAAAGAIHAAQGRYEELPLDAISMFPGGKGVQLAKGARLAATKVIGGIGRSANALQAAEAADAFGAPAYANGGKIKGPGTPTSDSIPANVEETGEPIQVSTGERILSRDQDAMLQGIAKKIGFDSLDALLEAGTGKPVGPTMKGGKMHAADGKPPKKEWWESGDTVQLSEAGSNANRDAFANRPGQKETVTPIGNLLDRALSGEWKGAGARPIGSASPAEIQKSASLAAEVPSNNQGSARSMAMGADTDSAMHNATRQTSLPNGIGSFVQNGQTYDVQNAGQEGIKRVTAKGQNPLFTNLDPSQATAQMAGMKSGTIQTGGGQKDAGWINDAYGNDMRPTIAMQKQLEQMQRDRYGRDLGSDIKDPRVMAAAAMGLSNMNQDRRASMIEQQQARQGISAGLDDQMKRNSLAAAAQQQSLIDKINDPQTSEEQRHVLRSNLLAMQGKNPNDHRYMQQPNRKIYNDMGQVIAEEPGGIFDTVNERNVGQQKTQQQSGSIHNDPRAAKIAQDKNLSMDEKRKQIAALGYSN